jgi:chemotaxis signal transduction protein
MSRVGVTTEEMAVLIRRAARLHAPVAAEPDAIEWAAELRVGDETYALPLASLRASVPLRMVTPVPLAPPHVIGILRFHGQIITALSLAALLGAAGWRADPAVLLVIETGGGGLHAIDCEQVPKSIPLESAPLAAARAADPDAIVIELATPAGVIRHVDPARLIAAGARRAGAAP